MTTTRDVLLLLAVTGTFALCLVEAATGHLWCSVNFGLLTVACAGMFMWQVREEQRLRRRQGLMRWSVWGLVPGDDYVLWRRVVFASIRRSRNWTWRVKR